MEVLNYNQIKVIDGLCGKVKESFCENIGFARVDMTEGASAAHFHRETVEYYLVLKGEGVLRIQNQEGKINEAKLKPGILVRIDKGEIHQTNNLNGLVLEAISMPVWKKEDEIESDINLF